jgi:hypothetical protein
MLYFSIGYLITSVLFKTIVAESPVEKTKEITNKIDTIDSAILITAK